MTQITNKIPNDTLAGQNTVERYVIAPDLIKQRYKGDCSVASLAMFLGVVYDDLLKHYPDELEEKFETGVWNHKTFEVAEKYGVELTCVYKNFDLSKPSLLIVPSLNIEGKEHTVYWDGKKIYDPATGIAYKNKPKNILYIFQKCEAL